MVEAALVILVPEAEALVEPFRAQHDPSAALGVPAHVTILYPFKPPSELADDAIADLRSILVRFPAFHFTLAEPRRFPDVLYLAPEPALPFQDLTRQVAERFPETPPYGGAFAEVIPHLTVAQTADAARLEDVAAQFEHAARGQLPIRAVAREVAWLDNAEGRWKVRSRLPLGAG